MCHVLIIEDETLVAMALEMCLASHGATSFDLAETEWEAIQAARMKPPAFITSDVNLRIGTGPAAVAQIFSELGPIPVVFITATPEACLPCEPPAKVFGKPLNEAEIVRAFRDMAAL